MEEKRGRDRREESGREREVKRGREGGVQIVEQRGGSFNFYESRVKMVG